MPSCHQSKTEITLKATGLQRSRKKEAKKGITTTLQKLRCKNQGRSLSEQWHIGSKLELSRSKGAKGTLRGTTIASFISKLKHTYVECGLIYPQHTYTTQGPKKILFFLPNFM